MVPPAIGIHQIAISATFLLAQTIVSLLLLDLLLSVLLHGGHHRFRRYRQRLFHGQPIFDGKTAIVFVYEFQ